MSQSQTCRLYHSYLLLRKAEATEVRERDCNMPAVDNIATAHIDCIPVTGVVGWCGAQQLPRAHAVLR